MKYNFENDSMQSHSPGLQFFIGVHNCRNLLTTRNKVFELRDILSKFYRLEVFSYLMLYKKPTCILSYIDLNTVLIFVKILAQNRKKLDKTKIIVSSNLKKIAVKNILIENSIKIQLKKTLL